MKRISPEEMQKVIYSIPTREPGEDYSRLMEATADAQLASCEKELGWIMTKMDHRIEALSLVLGCENPINRMAVKNVINGWRALKQQYLGELR